MTRAALVRTLTLLAFLTAIAQGVTITRASAPATSAPASRPSPVAGGSSPVLGGEPSAVKDGPSAVGGGPSPVARGLSAVADGPSWVAGGSSPVARGSSPVAGGSSATVDGPRIVRLDPRLDRLVPRDATLEKLADGFAWVEGPAWNRAGGYLVFSDIPNNSVFSWHNATGIGLFLKPSGYTGPAPFRGREPGSNGLTFDSAGRLVLCEHGDRRIARLESDGRKTVLADRYEGKRLNSPNDLAFTSNGDLYFTDPPFGLPQTFDDPLKELDFSGVYRLLRNGTLMLLSRDLRAPNGIAFSPSEKTLYVSNADPNHAVWMAYDVRTDGTLGPGRVFFDATAWTRTKKGAPDGMKVDHQGNLFTAGPGGLHVFAPDGTHLGSIETGGIVSNAAWGDDGSVLYLTADTAIYRIALTTKGTGF
jgi:gluconolactonase